MAVCVQGSVSMVQMMPPKETQNEMKMMSFVVLYDMHRNRTMVVAALYFTKRIQSEVLY